MKNSLFAGNILTVLIIFYFSIFKAQAQVTVDAGPDTIICGSGSVTIGGTPTSSGGTAPVSYTWTPTTGLSNAIAPNPIATVSATTTYIVNVSDFNGRGGMDTVTIYVINASNVKFNSIPSICENDTFLYLDQATPLGGTYSGPGIVTSPKLNPALAGPGLHTITYTYLNTSCTTSYTATQTIQIDSTPDVKMILNPDSICVGDTSTFSGKGASFYIWSPNVGLNSTSGSPIRASPAATTMYYLSGLDLNGCSNVDSAELLVSPCIPQFIGELEEDVRYKFYPNPTKNYINVVVNNAGKNQLRLTNLIGEQLQSWSLRKGFQRIDLPELSTGIYYLNFKGSQGQRMEKLLIER